jgi:uncharacterized protein (TIGR03083 family)
MAPALPPLIVTDLFPHERESLLTVLSSLSADQWATATACSGWSVHDVALHILGGDIGNLSGGRDRYEDRRATAGVDFAQWDQLLAFINRRNDDWVRATRRISPRVVCELLAMTGPAVQQYFAQLDLDAVGMPVNWAGPDPAPVWLHVAREYTERWMHQQHIRDAVEQPGLKERTWFAPVLDAFARALPHTLRTVTATPGTTVRLVVTGQAGGIWQVIRQEDGWVLTADIEPLPVAALLIDQETAWRLFTKGLSKVAAMPHVRLEGDAVLAAKALDMVSILA